MEKSEKLLQMMFVSCLKLLVITRWMLSFHVFLSSKNVLNGILLIAWRGMAPVPWWRHIHTAAVKREIAASERIFETLTNVLNHLTDSNSTNDLHMLSNLLQDDQLTNAEVRQTVKLTIVTTVQNM